ncbi:HAD-IA family hydrolase [Streptomyces sp. NPDC093085]|uniref:HAD family hydrolase n=1 Tax=Streptomyces sp. NPDC093085 TaxID=3155068 RepID=UPI003444B836
MTDSYATDPRAARQPLGTAPFDGATFDEAPFDRAAPAPVNAPAPVTAPARGPLPVRCVLFDFDGPVCALFRNHPAPDVAARLLAALPGPVREAVAPEGGVPVTDPQAVLRAVGALAPGSARVAEVEARLTEEEIRASESAVPTRNAAELIRALAQAGVALAVTTNNSPRAVRRYLDRTGLTPYFGGHVYGRRPDPGLLKPDPDCLRRALRWTGVPADEAAMIGDAEADFRAADRLGVGFLGYAARETKSEALYEAGARVVVDELPDSVQKLAAQLRQLQRQR